jgi:putative membrane protein
MPLLLNILKGAAIGIAFVLPGISAGTVILVLGFYKQFVDDLSSFRLLPYLPHLLGGAAAALAGVKIIGYLLENCRDLLLAFILGLLIASLRVILFQDGKAVRLSAIGIILSAASFLTAWFIFGSPSPGWTALPAASYLHFAAGGIIAGATMILPGISGSSSLVIMNLYDDVIYAVNHWEWLKLAVFSAGALLGIFILARLLSALYRRHQDTVSLALAGLVLGSVRSILPSAFSIPVALAALTGAAAVLALTIHQRPKTDQHFHT